MDEAPTILPLDMVTIGHERAVRMVIDAPAAPNAPLVDAPLVEAPAQRVSAAPSYTVALHFDWRRDEPMAAVRERATV